jgi:hypothetical protein
MTDATPLASEQITQEADELEALIGKATEYDLADDGRYFSETCNDLTSCHHGETGEYNDQHDGRLVEFLWNHRHHYLSLLRAAALSAPSYAPGNVNPNHPLWDAAISTHDATPHLKGCHGRVSGTATGWQPCSCYRHIRAMIAFATALSPQGLDAKEGSHVTRSSDASSYDEVCINCGATDITGGGWGKLAQPCPARGDRERAIAIVQAEAREMGFIEEDVERIAEPDGDDLLAVQAVERAFATPSQRLDAATVERCAQVADGERVEAEATGHPEDRAYNLAIDHVIKAILALATDPHQHGGKGA